MHNDYHKHPILEGFYGVREFHKSSLTWVIKPWSMPSSLHLLGACFSAAFHMFRTQGKERPKSREVPINPPWKTGHVHLLKLSSKTWEANECHQLWRYTSTFFKLKLSDIEKGFWLCVCCNSFATRTDCAANDLQLTLQTLNIGLC